MDDAVAGMGDIELNRAVRILEKRFTVLVLLEPDKSRIGTCVARQQAAKRSTTDNESDAIAIKMEPVCSEFLFLVQNGQIVIE